MRIGLEWMKVRIDHLLRLALRGAFEIRRIWRRYAGEPPRVCTIFATNPRGKILLVRHSYVEPDTWMLPGGQFARREGPIGGAIREIFEEVGLRARGALLFELEDAVYWDIAARSHMIELRVSEAPRPDMREVIAAQFFDPSNLPPGTDMPSRQRIQRWLYRNSFVVDVPAFVRPEYLEAKGTGRATPPSALSRG